MHQGKYVFSQIMDHVVRYQFNQCVQRYHGEYWMKNFSCWDQFLAMTFGQLAYRESLRDVVVCLGAQRDKLYHFGFRTPVTLSTLARANEHRDWRIYRDFAYVLIQHARRCYRDDPAFNLHVDGTVYVLDSTTIELCLSVFPWATFVPTTAAVKLHVLMDLKGNIPSVFAISRGNVNDVHFLDFLQFERGAYYVMDRGYLDYARLFTIHTSGAFFVTRAKRSLAFRRMYSRAVDRTSGFRCDQIIRFSGRIAAERYPDTLRRIKYVDAETDQRYVFLTNDCHTKARTIADIYKHRWQIELFFKWIKQHLKIQTFWGHSNNAVKTQICIAICAYLIVAIMRKRFGIERNLYEILQIVSVSLFDKTRLDKLISEIDPHDFEEQFQKQATLWDY